jgi:hypothetical protein
MAAAANKSTRDEGLPVDAGKLRLRDFFNLLLRDVSWRDRLRDPGTRAAALRELVAVPTRQMEMALDTLNWDSFENLANAFGEKDPDYKFSGG